MAYEGITFSSSEPTTGGYQGISVPTSLPSSKGMDFPVSTPEQAKAFSQAATPVQDNSLQTKIVTTATKTALDYAKDLWNVYQQTPSKWAEDVQAGAKSMQQGDVVKGALQAGGRVAGDAAIAIFAPISAAIGAVMKNTPAQTLTDNAGKIIADKTGITDLPAFQKFAMQHPNAGEDFNRFMMLAMSGGGGDIDPARIRNDAMRFALKLTGVSPDEILQGAKAATEYKAISPTGESTETNIPITKLERRIIPENLSPEETRFAKLPDIQMGEKPPQRFSKLPTVGTSPRVKELGKIPGLTYEPIKEGLPDNRTQLTIIRHGETANNADGLNRGMVDIPLNENGKTDASALSPKIKQAGVDMLVHSDLIRAKQTAEIISKETGIPIAEATEALRPWDLGKFSGKDIKETLPILQDYMRNKPDVPVDGGESFNQFRERAIQGIKDLMEKYPDKHLGLVTHHRIERLLDAYVSAGVNNDNINVEKMMVKGAEPASATLVKLESPLKEVTPQKTGVITKAASDINQTLIRQGFDALSPEEQSKYTPESYKAIVEKTTRMMDANVEEVKSIATGEKPVPKGLDGQIVFNAIEALATKTGDGELLQKLAASPLGKKLSLAGQTMGAAGFNDNPHSAVEAIREVQKARELDVTRRGTSIPEESATRIRDSIRKTNTKETWNSFISSLQC